VTLNELKTNGRVRTRNNRAEQRENTMGTRRGRHSSQGKGKAKQLNASLRTNKRTPFSHHQHHSPYAVSFNQKPDFGKGGGSTRTSKTINASWQIEVDINTGSTLCISSGRGTSTTACNGAEASTPGGPFPSARLCAIRDARRGWKSATWKTAGPSARGIGFLAACRSPHTRDRCGKRRSISTRFSMSACPSPHCSHANTNG
jgi:hypothetical protein